MPEGPYICVRQRAGPLVKECRSLRPRLCRSDTPFDRAQKNKILKPRGESSVCRSRTDRVELRIALFAHEGSFYTLTFDDANLPESFGGVEKCWRRLYYRLQKWRDRPFDYLYCIEGRHGDHRYHIHLVLRDSDFSPAEIRYLWGLGWVDDEPVLRGPNDSYRRLAQYLTKEATDGVVIPINKRIVRWSQSLNQALPPPERFQSSSGVVRIPKNAYSRGGFQTSNQFGEYRYGWYIKSKH